MGSLSCVLFSFTKTDHDNLMRALPVHHKKTISLYKDFMVSGRPHKIRGQ